MRKERDVRHPVNVGGRPDKGERHFPIRPGRTRAHEKVHFVGFRRVLMFLPGGEHCETAIDALGTLPTMGMKSRHIVHAGAAPRVPYQIAVSVC